MSRVLPPPEERALGLGSYMTDTPGIGGRLRAEPEDFQVYELGEGPPEVAGPHMAAYVRLRNWETNRFVGQAARSLGILREQVGFAGMKDKRAVTEQWFTFKCKPEQLAALDALSDVQVLRAYPTRKSHFPGAHEGNRFVLRVRDSTHDRASVETTAATIRAEGGVPNFFGPQRFGGAFRPITHVVGRCIVAGQLEEAVHWYVGRPVPSENPEAQEARRTWDETRDATATLAKYPPQLDPERAILRRLESKPGDWRNAIQALPENLLQLFVHAHQSWLYNEILGERVAQGLGLSTAHVGDRVMGVDHEGTQTALVTERNQAHIQQQIQKGRLVVTAPLIGLEVPLAEGTPGELERKVLARHKVEPRDFRIRELPEVASTGRRRAVMQPVRDLKVDWAEGAGGPDPVFSFALGKGSYATVVLREFMKAPVADY